MPSKENILIFMSRPFSKLNIFENRWGMENRSVLLENESVG